MSSDEEFFSEKHKRLIRMSVWLKQLAWLALIVSFIWPIASYLQLEIIYKQQSIFNPPDRFITFLKKDTVGALTVFIDLLNSFLSAFIYFLVLRGVSLGLNMIVETDINYRENVKNGVSDNER